MYYEARLNSVTNPSNVGAALRGRSVRTISEDEFSAIALAGFAKTLHDEDPHLLEYGKSEADLMLKAFVKAPPDVRKRKITKVLASRPLRDWAFRRSLLTAYKETCAVTGMRIVNGGGRAEVQAAHIQAVKHDGPDIGFIATKIPKVPQRIRHPTDVAGFSTLSLHPKSGAVQAACIQGVESDGICPGSLMGTLWSGFTPSSWKARFWTGVGAVTTDSRLSPWPGRRSWFSAMPERSSSRVRKLWTGSPSGVSFVSALAFALSETSAFSTGELGSARAPSRSSSSNSTGARRR